MNTTFYLSAHPSVDIWVAFDNVNNTALHVGVQIYLFEIVLSTLLGIESEV